MDWMAILWFVLLLIFLVAEAATIATVSIWFAIGALVALVASVLHAPWGLQLGLFVGVSALMLLLLRPILRKFVDPRIIKTNVDALVGQKCYVTAGIDNLRAEGQIKVGGMEWSARSTSGEPIGEGTLVVIDRVEGVRAFVSPAEVKV